MSYSLVEELKIRLDKYSVQTVDGVQVVTFESGKIDIDLGVLIEKAKKDIIAYRHYPARYTAEKIEEDITENYTNILMDLVLYDYSISGADYQVNHAENGVNRTFVKRESILAKVIPFCNVL